MNGIETITRRIEADAQAEIDKLLSDADAEAARIQAEYQAQGDREKADLEGRNARLAAEREERLVSVAHMESRKVTLAAKQKMVDKAFDLALQKLCAMPDETYAEVAAELLVRAAKTGREEVIFSMADRQRVGKAAVNRANELLALAAAPDKLLALNDSKLGAVLHKVAVGVNALAQGTALLTLSEETRDIQGGFILRDGSVEVNCTFETLVRLQRTETAGDVARILFG